MIFLSLLLSPSLIYSFMVIIGQRKTRLIRTKSRIHKALSLILITERLVNSHTYNKTYWVPSDDYLGIFFQ
jgi:hypothetical protein